MFVIRVLDKVFTEGDEFEFTILAFEKARARPRRDIIACDEVLHCLVPMHKRLSLPLSASAEMVIWVCMVPLGGGEEGGGELTFPTPQTLVWT